MFFYGKIKNLKLQQERLVDAYSNSNPMVKSVLFEKKIYDVWWLKKWTIGNLILHTLYAVILVFVVPATIKVVCLRTDLVLT